MVEGAVFLYWEITCSVISKHQISSAKDDDLLRLYIRRENNVISYN